MWQAAAQLIRPSNLDRMDAGARERYNFGLANLLGVGILGRFGPTIVGLRSVVSMETFADYLLSDSSDTKCVKFIASRWTHLSSHLHQQRFHRPAAHRFTRSYADIKTATSQLAALCDASKKLSDVPSVCRLGDNCCNRVHESWFLDQRS